MGRVALVTGGSRGIGEAISKKLQADGHTVAATYAGNDEAAAKFTEETGIKTYKWNVADYASSKAGIEQVEADLGPIDIVIANAGAAKKFLHKVSAAITHCCKFLSVLFDGGKKRKLIFDEAFQAIHNSNFWYLQLRRNPGREFYSFICFASLKYVLWSNLAEIV